VPQDFVDHLRVGFAPRCLHNLSDQKAKDLFLAAAVLHDLSANVYHKLNVANSAKHQQPAMTYSSLAQISKYANRASYEVLVQHSPRLSRGLPEREDCLEQVYWDQ